MTPWTSHCETGNCVETRLVGDQVEIRDTDRPEATLLVPAKAWEEFLASVRAEAVPGGEVREERGVVHDLLGELHRCSDWSTCTQWFPHVHGHVRTVTTYPDGSWLTTAWREVEVRNNEEESR